MICYLYDKTFTGFLCALFAAVRCWEGDEQAAISILRENCRQSGLFPEHRIIPSSFRTAAELWTTLAAKLPAHALRDLLYAFFTEEPGIEDLILHYLLLLLKKPVSAREVFADRRIQTVRKLAGRVAREIRRFQEITRFRRLPSGLYYGVLEPDYNILPFLAPYYKARFGKRQWLLHDRKRNTGLFSDGSRCHFLRQVELKKTDGKKLAPVLKNEDQSFQELWHLCLPSVAGAESPLWPGRYTARAQTAKEERYLKEGPALYAGKN
ncbi:MAG: DUF4130 domain-containing protein [Firmicutes bacterium]|nr:DUF4130 domain-containing protein [Bacillota bacterium]